MTGPEMRDRIDRYRQIALDLGHFVDIGVNRCVFMGDRSAEQRLTSATLREAWREALAAARTPVVSLYLHIPFCPRLCDYCLYHRVRFEQPALLDRYLERLHAELEYFAPAFCNTPLTTAYLGGGTPTILEEPQLAVLLERIEESFARRRGGEWSFETCPYTLTEGKAQLLRAHGFNRASIGVQSFHDETLRRVHREHQSRAQVTDAMEVLRRLDFNVNLDLLHGLPDESVDDLLESVRIAITLEPAQVHIGILLPNTPILPGTRDRTPAAELAVRLEELAGPAGYDIRRTTTSVVLQRPESNLMTEEALPGQEVARYTDVAADRPLYVLGFGPTARSHIDSRLRYEYHRYPIASAFDPDEPVANGEATTPLYERQRFVTHSLAVDRTLDPAVYRRRFGEQLDVQFGEALAALVAADRLLEIGGRFVHTTDDLRERFVTDLFFLDEEQIERLQRNRVERKEPGARAETEADRTVSLLARRAGIRFILHQANPAQQYVHRNGAFAYSVQGTERLTQLQRSFEVAFRQLFDQATRAQPASLAALQQEILRLAATLGARLGAIE